MRKIGLTLATLLAVATSACAESPTAAAAGAGASLNGVLLGSGHEEENSGEAGSGHVATTGEEDATTTTQVERNPGLGLTGH